MQRRRYLEGIGAVVSAAGSGLAGCLGASDGTAEENATADDGPDHDVAEFGTAFDDDYEAVAKWLPAPSVLETEPYTVSSVSPADVLAASDVLDPTAVEPLTELFDELAIDPLEPRDLDRLVVARYGDVLSPLTRSSLVVEGAVDPAAIEATLEDGGYDRRRDGDYDYYDGESEAYAVSDDVLVSGRGPSGVLSIVEAIADAERGDVPRYAAENDAFGRLAAALPAGHQTFVGPADPDEERNPVGTVVGNGTVAQVDGDETVVASVTVFEDGTDVDEEDVEAMLTDEADEPAATGLEYGVGDGLIWIRDTQPTAEFETTL